MPDCRGKGKIVLGVLVLALISGLYLFSPAPKSWTGIDEAVVEKIAKEHGREAKPPLIDPGEGDLLLFLFLSAGAVAGFAAGYYWRVLVEKKK